MHEIGHSLGLWHEQQRWDRDDTVHVLVDNLDFYRGQFLKLHNSDLSVPYDVGSVMHYGPRVRTTNIFLVAVVVVVVVVVVVLGVGVGVGVFVFVGIFVGIFVVVVVVVVVTIIITNTRTNGRTQTNNKQTYSHIHAQPQTQTNPTAMTNLSILKQAGSSNGRNTMETINPLYQRNMGQRTGLSFLDAKSVNLAYCSGKSTTPVRLRTYHP